MFSFKALLDAWRGPGLVGRMFAEFEQMLALVSEMFATACAGCSGTVNVDSARDQLRSRDKEVNRLQRGIRRQIVEHVTANPGIDVPACLVLMSIVKDAERLGDYARALFEASQIACPAVQGGKYAAALRKIEGEIGAMMANTRKALADSDETLANDIMSREDAVKASCGKVIEDLTRDSLSGAETVALTLLSWYLRRLTAHTANIASSVTNPVEWLDYKSKKPD
jgi:phosphate uptake regulator